VSRAENANLVTGSIVAIKNVIKTSDRSNKHKLNYIMILINILLVETILFELENTLVNAVFRKN
jgi:hypothetical protein